MYAITKNQAPQQSEIEGFLNKINFMLPKGFISFYSESNGAEIMSDESYTILWDLANLFELNKNYAVEEFAPGFFIFGADGGGTAFTFEKATGKIFEMPFIIMTKEEAIFISDTFDEFLESRYV